MNQSTLEPFQPARTVVLVPHLGAIQSTCETELRRLEQLGYCVRRVPGYASIDVARCQLATDALREDFQWLMWIDADIGFRAEDIERLAEHRLAIVGGVYVKKGVRALACHLWPDTQDISFGPRGGLLDVRYAATGFLLTHRQLYDAMQRVLDLPECNLGFGRPLVPYFQPLVVQQPEGAWYLAEDFAFCERARQAGFAVQVDTRIRLTHFGTYGYSWEDAGEDRRRYQNYRFRVQ